LEWKWRHRSWDRCNLLYILGTAKLWWEWNGSQREAGSTGANFLLYILGTRNEVGMEWKWKKGRV